MRQAGSGISSAPRRVARVAALLLGCSVAVTQSVISQSLTAGEVAGDVVDERGNALNDVLVTLLDKATGSTRSVGGARDGHYHISLVAPGGYELLVEHLGYRPVRVVNVVVQPGLLTEAGVALVPSSRSVVRVDTVRLEPSVGVGPGTWLARSAVRLLPDRAGDVADLGRLSSTVAPDLAADGLPGSLGGFLVDGLPYRPAHHSGLAGGQYDVALLDLSTLENAALVVGGNDVEWSGFAGTTLSAFSRQGTPSVAARLSVDATGSILTSSQYFDARAVSNTGLRGAFLLSGPVSRDSGQWVFVAEGRRLEGPLPPISQGGAAFDSVMSVAADSFKVGLGNYLEPRLVTTDAFTTFAGFRRQTSASGEVAVDARYATTTTTNPDLGLGAAPSLGATLNTRDFTGGATITSSWSAGVSQEARVGVEVSSRGYGGTNPLFTDFADLGMAVGSDPALPGAFKRTAVRASETVHYDTGVHRFKVGLSFALNAHDVTYEYGSSGTFSFSGPEDLAARRGAWFRSVLALPGAQFSVPEYGVFGQDVLTAAGGFELLLGLRLDGEQLPHSDVVANRAWLLASGLDNTAFPSGLAKWSPRVGLAWDVAQRHATQVQGTVGVYYDEVDPGLVAEAIATSLGDTVYRAVGALGTWPSPPTPSQAPAVGTALTLLAPQMQAPRTGRADLSVSQDLGRGLTLRLSGRYAHTDYLPQRTDLNILVGPTAHDQYGRPIYGMLVQQGDLVTVQPGTNRRFAGFDLVSAIGPTGNADYRGLTATLERDVGAGLHLLASYTYSRTTDNWLSGEAGGPTAQLSPFPQGLNGQDWTSGPSDFDIPHRVALSGELQTHLPLSPRIAAVYRYQSGAPFTPGFRAGVDVNGTGAPSPAFIDPALPGMTALLAQWDCLRGSAGQFAARNSCRDPAVQSLDLRITFQIARVGHEPLEIVLDGLSVLVSDVGIRDHALLLIDPTKSLTANAATSVVTVPFVANPSFGNVLIRETAPRVFRIGARVNF